jgi:hypothetical protein
LGGKFLSNFFIGLFKDFSVELKILFVLEYCDLFLGLLREDMEETIANLSLGDQRHNVINFKLSSCEFVVHLLDNLLQLFCEILAFLQSLNLFSMFVECLALLFNLDCFLSMQLTVVLQCSLDIFNVEVHRFEILVEEKSLFLGSFKVILGLPTVVFHLNVQILNHVCQVSSQLIDVVILKLNFLRDTFSKRGNISQNLAAFLHPNVKNFELFLNVLGGLFNLP